MAITFSFDLPCKPYVKRYLLNEFGEEILITKKSPIGKKLYALIQDPRKDRDLEYSPYKISAKVSLKESFYISSPEFLTKTNIIVFNNFLEDLIKIQLCNYIDAARCAVAMTGQNLKIADAIRMFAEAFDFDETSFPYDSMKKIYYRYRDTKNKQNRQKKSFSGQIRA